MTAQSAEVLILHGIWMRPIVMSALSNHLKNKGFNVKPVAYSSLRLPLHDNADQLSSDIKKHSQASRLHIVAHSLGGLLALHLLNKNTHLPPGYLVTLGAPVQGSMIASRLHRIPVLRNSLGQSFKEGLSGQDIPLDCGRRWGMIAGNKSVGVGKLLGGFNGQPNDGTVAVEETKAPAITEHLVLPVSHMQMLFNTTVHQQVAEFLQTGHFTA